LLTSLLSPLNNAKQIPIIIRAKGNPAILGSKILNAHSPVKMEGS